MNMKTTSGAKRFLFFALLLIFVGGLFAWWVQTDGGKIKIKDLRFMGADGRLVSALLYIPPEADGVSPAPGIVATHGYINSRETQDGFAIEFARRGYVVMAPDQSGHGFTDPPAFAKGFGGLDTLKYFRTLDIVDPKNIGLEGHSMGGWASVAAASANPDGYQSMVLASSSTGSFGVADGTPTFPRNLAIIFSRYDEFSDLMWASPIPRDVGKSEKMKNVFGVKEDIEAGKLYGSVEQGTARKLYTPNMIHPRVHFSTEGIGAAIEWMQLTLKGGKPIPPANQVWYWKEGGTFLALIGMILLLFPMGSLFLQTRFFYELNEQPLPSKGLQGAGWWVGAFLTILIPIPLFIFAIGSHGKGYQAPTAFWPQNVTTTIMYWALFVAVVSLILFLLWHVIINRKTGATAVNYGLSWKGRGVDLIKIWKSFLLALAVCVCAYLTLAFSDWAFKTDYRLWVFAIKPMSIFHFRVALCYLIPFIIYFLILGIVLHGQMRWRGDMGFGREAVINLLLLLLPYVICEAVQYGPLFAGGTLAIPKAALFGIVLFQFFPIFTIAALVSTYFFRKTGHVYVGAFLNAMLITWIVVAGQATHYNFM